MNDEIDFGLGVKTSIYNNELRSRRLEMGLQQSDLAKLIGVGEGSISHYETFRSYPLPKVAKKIAKFFDTTVDVLFPEWLNMYRLKSSTIDREIRVTNIALDSPELAGLLDAGNIDTSIKQLDIEFIRPKIREALDLLDGRQRKILTLHFGLEGDTPLSLADIGREFGISVERVRQIEAKALAMIRKKDIAKDLSKLGREIGMLPPHKKQVIKLDNNKEIII